MPDSPLQFSNPAKIRDQMAKRGWTEQQVREALTQRPIQAIGKNGPALRYVHPVTGKSVVVDAVTGEIFHVGNEGYLYE